MSYNRILIEKMLRKRLVKRRWKNKLYDFYKTIPQVFRSKIKYVKLNDEKFFVDIDELHINVSTRNDLYSLKEVKGFEKLTHLKTLWVVGTKIKTIENLDDLVNLEELHLSSNKIEDFDGVKNLRNIHKLVLQGNKITSISKNVEVLNLKYCIRTLASDSR